jgi:hypothetical protein
MPENGRTQLKSITYRHEAIARWLLCNPDRSLGDCAKEFKYTQSWLTQIIHSDMFQACYQGMAQELGEDAIHTMKGRLTAVALKTLDRVEEKLDSEPSERFLTDTQKSVFEALGYSSRQPEPSRHEHLHVTVPADVLVAARERAARTSVEAEAVEVKDRPVSSEQAVGEEVP